MNFFLVLVCAVGFDIFVPRWKLPFVKGACKKYLDVFMWAFGKIKLSSSRAQKIGGIGFVFVICVFTFATMWFLLFYAAKLHVALSFAVEVFCAVHLVDVRSFSRFILKNRGKYSANDSVITTVIQFTNYCIAPLFYIVLGGIPLAIMGRAVQYCAKGFAARGKDGSVRQGGQALIHFDEFLHFFPSYILVLAVLSVSAVLPFCNPVHGWYTFRRDRKNFAPHWKARIIAICAGVLGIQLAFTSNTLEKSLIGDATYGLGSDHIKMAVYLMYASSSLVLAFCLIFTAAFGLMIL